jgi:heterodisulfide reductase subunit C
MNSIFACYQCSECASECPLSYWFDVPPPRLLQYLQVGETEKAFKSRTPWLCASCETCATQCPHRIDLAQVMAGITDAARDRGFSPRVASVPRVYLPGADTHRRATELGLIPAQDKSLNSFLFEARWSWYQVRRRTRELLQRPIRLGAAPRHAPTLEELLSAIAFVVVAPPMALGLAAGLAMYRFHRGEDIGGTIWKR